ncbi:minor capsid protein, partial [Shewanella sp.]|uniref:minor capsid protein n=1 Tax=Shewanella sp. TaxID=50422 RepID=UPI003F33982D
RRVLSFDEEKRTKERLTKLIEKLAKELNKPAGAYLEQLKKELKDFARYESEYQSETIGDYVKLDLTTPTVGQLWAAAKFEPLKLGASPIDFEKLIDDWGSEEVSRLVMGVKSGFVQGLTTQQIIKEVIGDGGLIDISQRNAEAVARTAMQHVATTARIETYKANDDIVEGYEWVSTLDGRTSDVCRARDGTVYKFSDKSAPKPPAHYNCRSTITLKVSSEFDFLDEGATRASKDGQVDANLTYYDWLKQQPASFQDEVLGVEKGKIFRNAGLSAEEFRKITVDDLGRPLTLDEMAARDKRVAKYMRG